MIAVVGPGAVGGLLAALLHRRGHGVVAVARPPTAARIAREGITVDSDGFGRFTAAVPATTEPPAGAAVILTVKASGLDDVLPAVRTAQPTEVLALLNGTAHAPAVADLPGRTASGSVAVEAGRVDGVVRHHDGYLVVTLPDDAADLTLATALADAGATVRTGGSEAQVLWAKYRFLAAAALLTSWTGEALGTAMAADPGLTEALLTEVAALATADGVPTGREDIETSLHAMPPTLRTSLQGDLLAGRPGELEHLGGHLLTLGERHGVPTPATARIVTGLRERLAAGRG